MHAIPSIAAVSELAELVISANDSGIRCLGDISRNFAGIWEPTFDGMTLSFHVVRFLREPPVMLSAYAAQQLGYHSKSVQDVTKELRRLALEPWFPPIRQMLHQHITVPKILVSGSKGTGKSTLSRVLVNTMLTMDASGTIGATKAFPDGVILLDIDPGQPELAAPGTVYLAHIRAPLLGPSFTNLIVPGATENTMLRMHYLGANTPRESPSHYQRCVSDLLSLYRNYENIPLVINTCGWNSGSGKAVLLSAIRDVTLTNIVHIGDTRNTAVHDLMQSDVGGEQKALTQIPAQTTRTPLKSGRDLRQMQLQAYLHALGFANGRILWDQLPMAMCHHTLPAASDILSALFVVVVIGEDVAPEYILDVLDKSVAAVVVIKHDSPLHGISAGMGVKQNDLPDKVQIALTPDGQLPYLVHRDRMANALDPETTECIGLGLVTTVHSEKRQLLVKSPVLAAHIQAQIAEGCRIALVLARQQGLWSTVEHILV
jgi:polynucleotide 5'-hydroxyl-kinase GRC3/NOL9